MAWPLRPLGATQLVYNTIGPQFEQYVADTLGDYATEKDGFDALFTPAALALPDEEVQLAAFTPDLMDAGFTPGAFEAGNLLPIAKDTEDFTGDGDTLFADIGGAATSPLPSIPPALSQVGVGEVGGGASGGEAIGPSQFEQAYIQATGGGLELPVEFKHVENFIS